MRQRTVLWILVLALGTTVVGCGPKRDPEISKRPPGGAPGGRTAQTEPPATPIDTGPDVRPIPGEGAEEALIGGEEGEAGPLADVYFDFDQATLTEAARRTLESHAAWLQTHRTLKVTVEGHCDERGTVDYNIALGDRRAQAARDYLASLGVAGDRLTAISYGKERPADPGHDEAAWGRNRRCHFVVSR
jgi:peptidoglycan-associated lipoprotein